RTQFSRGILFTGDGNQQLPPDTAQTLSIGELGGAFSGLGLGPCGLATAALMPLINRLLVASTERIVFRRKKREARKTAHITGAAPRRWSVVASRYYRRFRCGGLGRRRLLSDRRPRP